ncbi:MAG TPA: hypothetical protein VFE51_17720 [Verrucomicrobiae bacterium]|nr:hypothetical protein [Verrucomicrobiae bacterium]
MKFAPLFTSLLLLVGCDRRDATLREQIVGAWARDGFEMTLAADGRYVSRWTQPAKNLTYQGMWKIQDGDIISTLTNSVVQGTTNSQAIGSVDRWVLLRLDHNNLVWSNNGQTVYLKRK